MSESEYLTFFHRIRNEIHRLDAGEMSVNFQKILYLTLLDSISGIVYDTKSGQGAHNFSMLVENFSSWSDSKRFSLTYLKRYLEINSNPALNILRTQIDRAYRDFEHFPDLCRNKKWINREKNVDLGCLSIENDLHESTLEGIFRLIKKKKIREFKPYEFKHSYLLYNYRSFLVHRFNQPGLRMRPEVGDQPYYEYYGVIAADDSEEDEKFELCYPNRFLDRLCSEIIHRTSEHFGRRNIDPMKTFSDTGFYIHNSLNKDLTFFDKIIGDMKLKAILGANKRI